MNKHKRTSALSLGVMKQLYANTRRAFVDLSRFAPWSIAIYLVSSIINAGSSLTAAYLFGKSIDLTIKAISHTAEPKSAYIMLALSLLFGLLEQLTFQINNITERRTFLRYQGHLEMLLNQKLSSIDMQLYEDEAFNSLILRVEGDSSWKPGNFSFKFFELIQATIRLIAPGIVLVSFAPWMLPILVIASIPSLISEYRLSQINWGIWIEDGDTNMLHWKLNHQLRYKETLKEVRLYGLTQIISNKIRSLIELIINKQDTATKKFAKTSLVARTIETGTVIGLTMYILQKTLNGALSLGSFTFYSSTLTRFSNGVGLLANSFARLLEYNLYMTDYYAVLDQKNVLILPDPGVKLDTKNIPLIEFKNVSFSYPSVEKHVLKDVSFAIKPGQNIALVGENGAGKTTIIKLLLRFYDVTEGKILINGHDIKEVELSSYYTHLGVLFQDFNRYPLSIAENVYFGDVTKEATNSSLTDALIMADMMRAVDSMPYKESTILDPSFSKGIEPSGGQWQRVALARAFFRDANVLILDEPTAAVDAKAEYAIFNNIFTRYENKTAIIISHRFSTVRKAKHIIVLEDGQISEQGTHEHLMKQNGLYKEMFDKQAIGYK